MNVRTGTCRRTALEKPAVGSSGCCDLYVAQQAVDRRRSTSKRATAHQQKASMCGAGSKNGIIATSRLLQIEEMLKAGYMEDWARESS
ncbi:hypothetical protein [Bradyrhizobium sp. STM 3562]|uniref:hypothetical protein n=1 Tax=Bradyrhizobium sp. STM 3562 TaxID=578924 RepID=UPI00388D88D8